jgi:thioredoxin 1
MVIKGVTSKNYAILTIVKGDQTMSNNHDQEMQEVESLLKHVNEKEFDEITAKGVTLVDFYADWCGPCKMIAPILEQLQPEYEGKVEIIKVDVDAEENLAMRYKVMSIPTLLLLKNGKVIAQTMGFQSKAMLEKFIHQAL